MGRQVDLAATQRGQPSTIRASGGTQDVRRPPDEHGAGRDHAVGRDEGALAEDAATQPGTRHQDGAVADFAQVTDPSADDRGAVAEDRALPDLDRLPGPADQHPFSGTAEWLPTATLPARDRRTTPWASRAPAPRCACPISTPDVPTSEAGCSLPRPNTAAVSMGEG
jgi:hypothetical protein